MAKLTEIDFTVFSGGVPVDNISSTTLNGTVQGFPVSVPILPGFSYRPGIYFPMDNIIDRYLFDHNTVGGEGLKMSSTYAPTSKRSFVFWYYCYSTAHDGGATNYIWGGDTNGFAIHSDGLRYVRDSSAVHTEASGTVVGWHNAVITIDRVGNEYRCYFDGAPVYNDAVMPGLGFTTLDISIGHPTTDRESDTGVGLVSTYDNILTPSEVSDIYSSFLVDSDDPSNFPYGEVSGKIFDSNGLPLDGAEVIAIYTANNSIVASDVTVSGGQYLLQFPSDGLFAISTYKEGIIGGRVVQATVSGGSVDFDTD